MKNKLAMILAASALAFSGCAADSSETDDGEVDPQTGEDAFTASRSRHAIVLAHGFDASTTNRWSFYKVEDKLREDGLISEYEFEQKRRKLIDQI